MPIVHWYLDSDRVVSLLLPKASRQSMQPSLWASEDQQTWSQHLESLNARIEQLDKPRLLELDRQGQGFPASREQ